MASGDIVIITMSGCAFGSESIASFMELPDQILIEEFHVAWWDVRDKERAMAAVAEAAGRLFVAATQQIDNRRRRNNGNGNPEPGHYRPFSWRREMLRLNLLAVLEEFEREEGRRFTARDYIRAYVRLIVKTALNHRPFWSVVGMAHVLCDYTAQQTLDIYRIGTEYRFEDRNWVACSRTRGRFFEGIVEHFGDRVHLRKEAGENQLNVRRAPAEDLGFLKHCFQVFAPPLSELPAASPNNIRLGQLLPRLEEGQIEMRSTLQFLDPEWFANTAAGATSGNAATAFDAHARILDIGAPADPDPGSPDEQEPVLTESDLQRLRREIRKHRNRARRRVAGSIRVTVDGIERAVIDDQNPTCRLLLEEGASIVNLIARDDEGSFTLATYVLTYDSPKGETWDVSLSENDSLRAAFEYRDDDSVVASIGMGPGDVESAAALIEDHRQYVLGLQASLDTEEARAQQRGIWIDMAFGSGKTHLMGFIDELCRLLSDCHRALICITQESDDKIDRDRQSVWGRLDALFRIKALEQQFESTEVSASGLHRDPRSILATEDTIKQIDSLIARQANTVDRFLDKAGNLSFDQIPCIHRPHDRISRLSGLLAVTSIFSGMTVTWFFKELVQSLGLPWTTSWLVASGAVLAVAVRTWWCFGWSRRLFKDYSKAEQSLRVLCEEVTWVEMNQSFSIRDIADWRNFPLARALTTLLQSGPLETTGTWPTLHRQRTNDTEAWSANTISERDLICVISSFGEEEKARRIARVIVAARPFGSVVALARTLGSAFELSRVVTDALVLVTEQSKRCGWSGAPLDRGGENTEG
jgi:hypothetical protein